MNLIDVKNLLFNYKIYSDETQQGQAKIINFKTKLTEKNKTSMKMIIIDSIITIVGAYFIFAFFIGVLFEVENWAEMVKFPVTFFAVTYIECHYTYSKSE